MPGTCDRITAIPPTFRPLIFIRGNIMKALLAAVVVSAGLLGATLAADVPAGQRTALDADPAGWMDLMPGKDLAGWKRVPIPPDKKLSDRNPWRVDAKAGLLICDGVGIKEAFLNDAVRGDGIFHVEWRFPKVTGKQDYNSGIYVRTAGDARTWHQAQVAQVDKAPHYADLFGQTLRKDMIESFLVEGSGAKLVQPPGAWNTYEITCKGKTIAVAVNGTPATRWEECAVPTGHVGMQAEFFRIEFRTLKFKNLK
jgi:hypothetical protein